MEPDGDEVRRLEGCFNDLISILALPANWTGREPSHVLSTLVEALFGMLRLDFAYARLSDAAGARPSRSSARLPGRMGRPAGGGRGRPRPHVDGRGAAGGPGTDPVGTGRSRSPPSGWGSAATRESCRRLSA